ncbi:MAG: M50 family metallopeptidase [Polyangiaceae bacterium]
MYTLVAIIGLAILMIVHEAGHFIIARRAGMRVTKFSVGFGPTFFKIQPILDPHGGPSFFWFTAFGDRIRFKLWTYEPARHGPTIYQVAMIPFLAYVQIAGLNPLEEVDPADKGSYANARLWPRIFTIAGGPAANYLFASVFFFIALFFHGQPVTRTIGPPTQFRLARDERDVVLERPASKAGLLDGDRFISIDGKEPQTWEEVPNLIGSKPGQNIHLVIGRGDETLEFDVVADDEKGKGRIGVQRDSETELVKLTAGEAAVQSLEEPVLVIEGVVAQIAKTIRGSEDVKLGSVVAMVNESSKAAEEGWDVFIRFLGALSAYLAVFNLLPLPALDGGRLAFLGFEAVTAKKPNPKTEAHIHAIGLILLLGLMLYVTFANDLGLGSK